MQATSYTYDPETRTGSVLLDDGTPLPFDAAAFDAGGLRLLRPGQRVRIEIEKGGGHGGADTGDGGAADGTGDGEDTENRRITLVTLQTL